MLPPSGVVVTTANGSTVGCTFCELEAFKAWAEASVTAYDEAAPLSGDDYLMPNYAMHAWRDARNAYEKTRTTPSVGPEQSHKTITTIHKDGADMGAIPGPETITGHKTPGINPGVRVRLKETNAVGATAIVDGWLSDKLVRIVWEWNGHRSEVEAAKLVVVGDDHRPSDAPCAHAHVRPEPCDQTLGVKCVDCKRILAVCWAEEHIPESLWNRACTDKDPDAKRCEQNRPDHCAICEEHIENITTCAYCGEPLGHSKRCSVTKFQAPEQRTNDAPCAGTGCRDGVHEPPCSMSDPRERALYATAERRLVAHLRGLLKEAIEHLDAMPEKHRPGDSRMSKLRQGLRLAPDARVDKARSKDSYICHGCGREQRGQSEVRWGPSYRFCSFKCARESVVGAPTDARTDYARSDEMPKGGGQ
jgi:hypothetical protein